MDDSIKALGYLEWPYKLCKADGGAIKFTVTGYAPAALTLLDKECPHNELYLIVMQYNTVSIRDFKASAEKTYPLTQFEGRANTNEFWLSWYNDVICLGLWNEPPCLRYNIVNTNESKQLIGFIKFKTYHYDSFQWKFEPPPIIRKSIEVPKAVNGGKLRWVPMTPGDVLPIDAMIAGFENEPLYIARAQHRGSLCPGKYVKSKQQAFVPWGSHEFPKDEFEVLCGYDAMWVKCFDSLIPENAFIGGKSEVRNEPLYIGRAMIGKDLIPGKVHMLYKTCYLPYNGREVEKGVYEILVTTQTPRGQTCDSLCYMKMVWQPCIGQVN